MPAQCRWLCLALLGSGSIALVTAKAPAADPPKQEVLAPTVVFKKESMRHPDPTDFLGQGDPAIYEWDDMPLCLTGLILVIYHAKSDREIRSANLRYRVIAKGIAPEKYPEEYRKIQHPQADPKAIVFAKLPLKRFEGDPKKLGKFVPDLGLFEKSWEGLDGEKIGERDKANVELYVFPGGKEAGGRINFEIAALQKAVPNGTGGTKTAKLEVGDIVELYVEVFNDGKDGTPDPIRSAGYTKAKQKVIVTQEEAVRKAKERFDKNRPKE